MKVVIGTVCLAVCSAAVAQNEFKKNTSTQTPTEVAAATPAAGKESESDWNPRLLITLSLTPGGGFQVIEKAIPIHEVRLENGPNGQRREVLTRREQTVRIQQPGKALLACDEANITVNAQEDELQHQVSCTGRVCLLMNGLQIKAASLDLKDGQILLEKASIRKMGFSASAEKLALTLKVVEVSTRKFGRPVDTMPAEAVDAGAYLPGLNDPNQGREWSPQPVPETSFNSPETRQAPGAFREPEFNRVHPPAPGTGVITY